MALTRRDAMKAGAVSAAAAAAHPDARRGRSTPCGAEKTWQAGRRKRTRAAAARFRLALPSGTRQRRE